jgi:hypothetical protein
VNEFYSELMSLMCRDGEVSKSVWQDMYSLRSVLSNPDEVRYELLCFVALRLARSFKIILPDGLHNRMIIGPQNDRTKQYVKFCVRLEKSIRGSK